MEIAVWLNCSRLRLRQAHHSAPTCHICVAVRLHEEMSEVCGVNAAACYSKFGLANGHVSPVTFALLCASMKN